MRVVICDILYQGTDCHFKQLACALNHSCLQLERRCFFPVSSITICYCLSYLRRRAGLAVSDTDTQILPDSRMNPSSKHPARLSLGRLLLSASLVTRVIRIVSRSATSHISNSQSRTLVATFACNKDSLSAFSNTRLTPHLPVPCRSHRGRNRLWSASSVYHPNSIRIPSSWPAL